MSSSQDLCKDGPLGLLVSGPGLPSFLQCPEDRESTKSNRNEREESGKTQSSCVTLDLSLSICKMEPQMPSSLGHCED